MSQIETINTIVHTPSAEEARQPVIIEVKGIELTLLPVPQKYWQQYEVVFCGIFLGMVAESCFGRWINSLPSSINGFYPDEIAAAQALFEHWDFEQEQKRIA